MTTPSRPPCPLTAPPFRRWPGLLLAAGLAASLLLPDSHPETGPVRLPTSAAVAQDDSSDDDRRDRLRQPDRDQDDDESAASEPTSGDKLASFARLLRIGQTSRGILIPAVERGSMTSMTKAESLTRRSEDYLDLVELVIQFYSSDGEPDARLSTPHAEFHLPSGILVSHHRTQVSRSDFDLEGDRFAFDTETRRGRFEGNVTMVIHTLDRFTEPEPGSEPATDGDTAAEPDDQAGPGADDGAAQVDEAGTEPAPVPDPEVAPETGSATAVEDS